MDPHVSLFSKLSVVIHSARSRRRLPSQNPAPLQSLLRRNFSSHAIPIPQDLTPAPRLPVAVAEHRIGSFVPLRYCLGSDRRGRRRVVGAAEASPRDSNPARSVRWRRGGEDGAPAGQGRIGAAAADERDGDPSGDGARAARGPARVHVRPVPASLPGVRVPPPLRGGAGRGRRAAARAQAPRRRRVLGAPAHAFRQAARTPPHRHARLRCCFVPGAPHASPRGPRSRSVQRRRGVRREAARRGRSHPRRAPRVATPRRNVRARVRGRRRRPRRFPCPPRRCLLHAQGHALPARHCRPRRALHGSCLLRGVRAHGHRVQPRRRHCRSGGRGRDQCISPVSGADAWPNPCRTAYISWIHHWPGIR
jgi:hypothetical protein